MAEQNEKVGGSDPSWLVSLSRIAMPPSTIASWRVARTISDDPNRPIAVATFERSLSQPDRLDMLWQWVAVGGGLVVVGGYMSYSGIEAKAGFGKSALHRVAGEVGRRDPGATEAIYLNGHSQSSMDVSKLL